MRRRVSAALCGCILSAAAGVTGAWPVAAPEHAASAVAARAAAGVAQQQAEVRRLQHEVAAQQARQQAATNRLREQDRMIRDLREQLRASGAAKPAPTQ